jgi:hypothetical protein
MTTLIRRTTFLLIGTAVFASAMLWNGTSGFERGLVSASDARVGRPLTPMSYAGVARRTTRRAVAVGAAVGVAGTAAYVASPGCVQVTDAYGRIVTRC